MMIRIKVRTESRNEMVIKSQFEELWSEPKNKINSIFKNVKL
jgi:hypothetical protein